MEINFKQTLTREAYNEFANRYYFKKTPLSTKITYGIIFGIGVMNLIFRIFLQGQNTLTNIWVSVAFCGFPFLMYLIMKRNMNKNFKAYETQLSDLEYTFLPDRFIVLMPNKNRYETHYETLISAEESENLYLLFIQNNQAHIIDKQQIPVEQQADFSNLFHKIVGIKTASEHLVD